MFSLITTIDTKSGISRNKKIPWYCPEEFGNFTSLTFNNVVIMGRVTWDSLSVLYKPIPNCINVVISRYGLSNNTIYPNFVFNSINRVVEYFNTNRKLYIDKKLFIIGGGDIYEQFLNLGLISDVHITLINRDYLCDNFIKFPDMMCAEEMKLYGNEDITYCKYYTVNAEENQFIKIILDIISYGKLSEDRTGNGVKSVFSREIRFDLSNGRIPLITTQKMDLRDIFEELMWMLRGQTDSKILNKKKIHSWDYNTSREYLDSRKLFNLPTGDIGPSNGFQLRHFGAEYIDCDKEYVSGFDQLKYVINLIKTNPNSRRIIINLWNPNQLNNISLPSCIHGYQFYVSDKKLSCKILHRSSNIILDGSHNCVQGALLINMLCKVLDLTPGEVIWSPSDIFIYMNQINDSITQINRFPKPFPILHVNKLPKNNDILNFEYSDFILINYDPWPKISYVVNN